MELKTGKSFSFIAVKAATVSVAQSTPTTKIKSLRGKSMSPADWYKYTKPLDIKKQRIVPKMP